ncbi:MAG: hypothetical protein IPF82_13805 [Blastocatellia bacterium]|nr:hypothetical protein [Blastocatellia bacterium]
MASEDLDAQDAELTTEESQLRLDLSLLHDELHGKLGRDVHHHADAIANIEKRIRAIVLRLTQVERERIELNIARSL